LVEIEGDEVEGLTTTPKMKHFSRYTCDGSPRGDIGPHKLIRKAQLWQPTIGTFIDKTVTICDQPNDLEPKKANYERTLHLFFTNYGIFAVDKNEVKVLSE
jgi:hypothetical protein